jgi:Fe-Mn family superoxide dismutase
MFDKKDLLDLADKLDEKGLESEADLVQEYLTKTARKSIHKCGLSEDTISHHEELLEAYEKAMKHFEGEYKKVMRSNNEKDSSNYGKLREITSNYAHNCNAVRLHNLFMDDVVNCKPFSLEKDSQMKDLMKDLFDGQFETELKRLAKIPRSGWVVLNFCTITKKLYLSIIDLHDQNVVACAVPVMALDMWEHSYFSDFGLDKEAYVEWFLSQLDWRNVRKRVKNYQRIR